MLISWKLFYISSLLPHQFQSVLVCILGYKMGCSLCATIKAYLNNIFTFFFFLKNH
ncbi:hypothetical protein Hanom_Chr06g00488231 [Helianthus anomalus]